MKLVKFNEPVTFSNLLDDFFSYNYPTGRKSSTPMTNIVDNDNEYIIEMAAPGKEKEDFEIKLDKDMLTISCSKKEETCKKEKNYSRQEFCYCNFSRSFTITEEIDRDKIEAKYDKGILKLILPKKAIDHSKNTKMIAIK